MDKNLEKNTWLKVFVSVFALAILLFLIGLCLYYQVLLKVWPNEANTFIALYASIAGGLCTLIGVVLNMSFESSKNKKINKEKNEPVVYIPSRYDIVKADRIRLRRVDNQVANESKRRVFNKNLYFCNSEKTAFKLTGITIDGVPYNFNTYFAEKGKLFCLSFFSEEKTIKNVLLTVKALDGTDYTIDASIEKCSTETKEIK